MKGRQLLNLLFRPDTGTAEILVRLGFNGDASICEDHVLVYASGPNESDCQIVLRVEHRSRRFVWTVGIWYGDDGAPEFNYGPVEANTLQDAVSGVAAYMWKEYGVVS